MHAYMHLQRQCNFFILTMQYIQGGRAVVSSIQPSSPVAKMDTVIPGDVVVGVNRAPCTYAQVEAALAASDPITLTLARPEVRLISVCNFMY